MKSYRIAADQIKPVATGFGSCFASDRITVDGRPVGYCYREAPDDDADSGWRFFAGDESQAFSDDADNFSIYDVNTIANYDPGLLAILEAPVGSAFERNLRGELVPVREET
jgi:hypothetical protein